MPLGEKRNVNTEGFKEPILKMTYFLVLLQEFESLNICRCHWKGNTLSSGNFKFNVQFC